MAVRIDAGLRPASGAPRLISQVPQMAAVPHLTAGLGRVLQQREAQAEAEREQARREAENASLSRHLSDFQIAEAERLQAAAEAYDGSAPGFVDRYAEDLDRNIDTALENAPDEIRTRLEASLQSQRTQSRLAALDVEVNRTRAYTLRSIGQGVDQWANAVRTDEAQLGSALENIALLTEALPPSARGAVVEEATEMLAAAYGQRRVETDPAGFIEELDSGDLDDLIDPSAKDQYRRAAEREIARLEAEAERRANEQRMLRIVSMQPLAEDNLASIRSTGVPVEGFDAESYMADLTPAAASAYRQQLTLSTRVFDTIGDLRGLQPSEMTARLEALTPEPGSAGFAQASEVYSLARSAMEDHLAARADDPAQYAGAASTVQSAAAALSEAQESGDAARLSGARQAYAAAQWAEQNRLGIPAHQRRIMSPERLQQEVAALEAMDEAERPQAIRDLIGRAHSYGAYAPQILSELRDAGLNETISMVAELDDPVAQTVLIRAMTHQDALESRLEARDRTDLRDAVNNRLSDLTDSFTAMGGGYAAAESLQSAAYLYALDAMAQGASRNRAAERAAGVFAGQYVFRENYRIPRRIADENRLLRVPVSDRQASLGGTAMTTRTVPAERLIAHGSEIALDGLRANDGANLALLETEGDLVSRGRITANRIANNSRWITLDDDSGLMLVADPGDGVVTPVQLADGLQVQFSWEELAEMGRARIERRDADAADILQPVLNARRGIDENEAGVRPRGRATGRGLRNAPVIRQFAGDRRQRAANTPEQAARAADLLDDQ